MSACFGLLLVVSSFLVFGSGDVGERTLRVHIATWNVASKEPPDNLNPLFGLTGDSEPDLLVIGLQEITMRPDTALWNGIIHDKWTRAFDNRLHIWNYKRVKTERLIGIVLSVFVKEKHYESIVGINSRELMTGNRGLYGNKGAVSIDMELYKKKFRFVNCHLPAHDVGYSKRLKDYHLIKNHIQEDVNPDLEFWLGDLNFRLTDQTLSPEAVRTKIFRNETRELFFRDELSYARSTRAAFFGFEELPVNFPPTFKFVLGTSEYNTKRRPAWTDRVLYMPSKSIQPLTYNSLQQYTISDHKPVVAQFNIVLST